MMAAERCYLDMIEAGKSPQEARAVLPNSLKTEIVVTANLREWGHFFKLRAVGTTGAPHPQMREVAVPLLREVRERVPIIFDDLVLPEDEA
jgi:thymidylate synthase (FAD)